MKICGLRTRTFSPPITSTLVAEMRSRILAQRLAILWILFSPGEMYGKTMQKKEKKPVMATPRITNRAERI